MEEYSERLVEIKDEIKNLIQEAQHLVNDFSSQFGARHIYERARSYWIAHLLTALDKDNDYLGGSMQTMEDTIQEIEEVIEDRLSESDAQEDIDAEEFSSTNDNLEGEPEEEII
jgi:hypothetical protein